ncbi:hypothetical protein GCM10010435_83480 [Winogradskya consettensis]|uniref:Protein kinase domain-containing protein n=1 Tax=Winogradskya consettensis TaxID=113560 RepID=A0A919VY88_9ACTN|nr:serine/threonine-protein kinase [Actinoplanes consettensis]GIM82246.1 hypothetical protein Aco04nite_80620 [Actinoplanes consettensis]
MSTPLRPRDPHRLGGYTLLSRLGEGGMGAVFLGRDDSGRFAAIKVIRSEYAADAEFRGRFRSEVNRARQVPPFCTAAVLDADPEHETPYLVVEYVDGPSLTEVVEENGPLTGGNLYSVAVGIATAIAAIHGAGVIHRDLKPRNVLFSLGNPKVIDFGIARAVEITSKHTKTDQMVGTVAYMAPERFDSDGSLTGPAADVFAWGAVISYAGTGRTPFAGDTPAVTAAKILTQPPELGGLPEQLKLIVARTLAKDPRERPTAQQLLEMLLSGEASQPAALAERPELRQAAQAVRRPPVKRRTSRATYAIRAVAALGLAVVVADMGTHALTNSEVHSDQALMEFDGSVVPVAGPRAAQPKTTNLRSWKETDDNQGRCAWGVDGLEVVNKNSTSYACDGPTTAFSGDQDIAAEVRLVGAQACFLLRFRWVKSARYELTACEEGMTLSFVAGGVTTELGTAEQLGWDAGTDQDLRVELRGAEAFVFDNDVGVIRAALPSTGPAEGRIVLGATVPEGTGGGLILRSVTVDEQ